MAGPGIHIRRCDVRLVRQTADGAHFLNAGEHRTFARQMQPLVLGMIEDMVAQRLADYAPDTAISRLDLRLELPAHLLRGAMPLARSALREKVDAAVSETLAKAQAAGAIGKQSDEAEAPEPQQAAPAEQNPEPHNIVALLAHWRHQRQLGYRLAALGPAALEYLFAQTFQALRKQRATGAAIPAQANAEAASGRPMEADDALAGLRTWLARVAEWRAAEALDDQPRSGEPTCEELLAEAHMLADWLVKSRARRSLGARSRDKSGARDRDGAARQPSQPPDGATPGALGGPATTASDRATTPPLPGTPPSSVANGRYEIACALPFLALLRLADYGVLDPLGEDSPSLRALAFAVALKLQQAPLDPLRPWSDEAKAGASLAAGLAQTPDGSTLADASAAGEAVFDLARSGVNAAMRPALLGLTMLPALHVAGEAVLFDPVGYYPAGCVPAAAAGEILGGKRAVLMLPAGDAPGLAAFADAGLKAVCEGAPARGERFVPISGPRGWRGVANCPVEDVGGHRSKLLRLAQRAERALAIWRELVAMRPLAAAHAAGRLAALDRCAALLCGFALADIAFRLSERDPGGWTDPDPLLALGRFADFSARLDISDGEVAVTVPLGRRLADLMASGLLEPTPRLGWLGGRVLRVGGG